MRKPPKGLSGLLLAALAASLSLAVPAGAAEVEVKMLNRSANGTMVFEPALVTIQPGDSVRFVPTDKSHNAQSIAGMLPEGAAPFKGGMNEEIVVTFEREGIYGYECAPHAGMGMVGVVVVGKPDKAADALKKAKLRGKGRKAMEALIAQLPR